MTAPSLPVGLLPAAGRGRRFGTSGYAKELFPLLFESVDGATVEPRPICELALRAIREAGAERCVTVISGEKTEMLRVLGSGASLGLSLAYVVQPEPIGLPDVVRLARPWLGEHGVLFAMPDTVFLPTTALAEVQAARLRSGDDAVLGVFPVEEAERLGPVAFATDGTVARIYDKPGETPHKNTWGVASWSPRFTEFCIDWTARQQGATEVALGHVFEAARSAGLAVSGRYFPSGKFLDIGTPEGLRGALDALAADGVVVAAQAGKGRPRREPGL